MATTIVDWLNDGTIPQSKTSGNWTPADFNTGKFRFTLTFTAASSGSPWRPASLTYWGVLTTNEANGSAVWLEWDPGTSKHRLLFVAADGSTFLAAMEFTWGASTAVTVKIDQSSATASASTMVLSGASTGNGTSAGWTRASVLSGSALYFGVWGAGGFQLPAGSTTTSDIDDANDVTTRTAAGTDAAVVTLAASRTVVRGAAGTDSAVVALAASRTVVRAAAATMAAAVALAAVNEAVRTAAGSNTAEVALAAETAPSTVRGASGSNAPDVVLAAERNVARGAVGSDAAVVALAAERTVVRGAAGSDAAAVALAAERAVVRGAAGSNTPGVALDANITGAVGFGIGVTRSAIDVYGRSNSTTGLVAPGGYLPGGGPADEDGLTPVQADTQPTGSTFYAFVGRPTSVNTAITDTVGGVATGNTYSVVQGQTLNSPWTAWELYTYACVNGAGGTDHKLRTDTVTSDEATLGWTELTHCSHLHDSSLVFHGLGTTYISDPVDLAAPGWVIVDWIGDSGTYGAEGFDWTVEAVGEGTTQGTHWQVLDSRLNSHTNGWIQWKRWAKYFPTATTGIQLTINSSTIVPDQGAYLFAASFQEANVVARNASGTDTAAVALSAVRTVVRGATGSDAAAVALQAVNEAVRTAAGSNAPDVALAATRTSAGVTAAGSNTAAVDLAAIRTVVRGAAGSDVAAVALAATNTAVRTAAGSDAAAVALAATREIARAAAGGDAAAVVLAAERAVVRGAAGSNTAEVALAAILVQPGIRQADGVDEAVVALAIEREAVRSASGSDAAAVALDAARVVVRQGAGDVTAAVALAMTSTASSPGTSPAVVPAYAVAAIEGRAGDVVVADRGATLELSRLTADVSIG